MAADNTPARPSAPSMGGTVEPANRATVAKEKFQTPAEPAGTRYELRDPFAEVTYRAKTMPEMVAKAEQIGSSRFVEVAEDGKRTTIEKLAGQWRRGPQRPASAQRPEDSMKVRDEPPQTRTSVATPAAAKAILEAREPTRADIAPAHNTDVVSRIDAQAERASRVASLEAALLERYVIKRAPVSIGDVKLGHTEYRFRGDTSRVAFTESTFKLATDTNSPSVARSMLDVAEARNWKSLRVSGNEDFRRMVWLEASVRGVKTIGYEPNPADLEVLGREREGRLVNRIEPTRGAGPNAGAASAEKGSARGSGSRKAVLAAVEAVLVARKVPQKQREAVMAAAAEKLDQRIRAGQPPKVKVYDPAAPSQRPAVVPMAEAQRTRERAAPAPVR